MEIELSVVLLSYNNWLMTSQRLVELASLMPYEEAELVWIDNGSTEEDYLVGKKWWNDHYPKLHQDIRIPKNVGFQMGLNFGAERAKGKRILLLSNDVKITSRTFVSDIITMIGDTDKTLLGGRIIDWDSGWNSFQIGARKYIIPYLEGYALAMTKEAWNDIGGFDTRYTPYDYEDIDLSLTAYSKGYLLSTFPRSTFLHQNGGTISNEGRENITLQNKEKFFDKWKDQIPNIFGSKEKP